MLRMLILLKNCLRNVNFSEDNGKTRNFDKDNGDGGGGPEILLKGQMKKKGSKGREKSKIQSKDRGKRTNFIKRCVKNEILVKRLHNKHKFSQKIAKRAEKSQILSKSHAKPLISSKYHI